MRCHSTRRHRGPRSGISKWIIGLRRRSPSPLPLCLVFSRRVGVKCGGHAVSDFGDCFAEFWSADDMEWKRDGGEPFSGVHGGGAGGACESGAGAVVDGFELAHGWCDIGGNGGDVRIEDDVGVVFPAGTEVVFQPGDGVEARGVRVTSPDGGPWPVPLIPIVHSVFRGAVRLRPASICLTYAIINRYE